MSREDKDTQMSVHEAMSLMAPAFKGMDAASLGFLEALLATHVEGEDTPPQVRLVAAQYAGEVFAAKHVASRFILALAAGDEKQDVAAAAKGHLLR